MDHGVGLFSLDESAAAEAAFVPASTQGPRLCIKPILLTAVSADGTDYVQVDARKWVERIVRTAPMRLVALGHSFFISSSDGPSAELFREALNEIDADTALFLVRMKARRSEWTCSFDGKAITEYLKARQPDFARCLEPVPATA